MISVIIVVFTVVIASYLEVLKMFINTCKIMLSVFKSLKLSSKIPSIIVFSKLRMSAF